MFNKFADVQRRSEDAVLSWYAVTWQTVNSECGLNLLREMFYIQT